MEGAQELQVFVEYQIYWPFYCFGTCLSKLSERNVPFYIKRCHVMVKLLAIILVSIHLINYQYFIWRQVATKIIIIQLMKRKVKDYIFITSILLNGLDFSWRHDRERKKTKKHDFRKTFFIFKFFKLLEIET